MESNSMALKHLSQRRNQQKVSTCRFCYGTQWHLNPKTIDNPVDMRSLNVFINPAGRLPCAPPRNLAPEISPPMLVNKYHEFDDAAPAILREFLENDWRNQ
jgi:hypothetical protein